MVIAALVQARPPCVHFCANYQGERSHPKQVIARSFALLTAPTYNPVVQDFSFATPTDDAMLSEELTFPLRLELSCIQNQLRRRQGQVPSFYYTQRYRWWVFVLNATPPLPVLILILRLRFDWLTPKRQEVKHSESRNRNNQKPISTIQQINRNISKKATLQ